jgi:hypothetical protein
VSGAVPVATTVKVAACPLVTVWLVGCAAIEGATGPALFPAPTIPEHPALTNANGKNNDTTFRRFMIPFLTFKMFPRKAAREESMSRISGQPALAHAR